MFGFGKQPVLNLVSACFVGCMGSLAVMPMAWGETIYVNWEGLDLSNQQRTQINQVDQTWRGVVTDMAPRIQANERRLKQLMSAPDPNEAEILRLQHVIDEDKARLKQQATQLFLDKRKVLNREQQDKLIRMMAPSP